MDGSRVRLFWLRLLVEEQALQRGHPIAALVIAVIAAKEGRDAWLGKG